MSRKEQTSASLLTLPSELMDEILSHFTASRDLEADWRMKMTLDEQNREEQNRRGRATLYKLCLVSKGMHFHAEPALYSWVVMQSMTWRDTQQLCAFVLRFDKDPRLAKGLKYVEFQSAGLDEQELAEKRRHSLVAAEEGRVYRAIEQVAGKIFGPNTTPRWKRLFGLNVTMALGALILQLAHDIIHISIPALYHIPHTIDDLFGVFPPESAPKDTLVKLRILCSSIPREHEFRMPNTLGHFMQSLIPLSQLKQLKVDCGRFSLSDISHPEHLKFSNLQSLILQAFGDTLATLAAIVEGCNKLKNFECYMSPANSVPGGNALSADLSALERSLEKHKLTLRSLAFRLDVNRHRGPAVPLSTLAEFPVLTTLSVDTVSLLGKPWSPGAPAAESRWWFENSPFRLSERLPPRLTELSLYDYHHLDDGVPLVISDLADDCPKMFPDLKLILVYHVHNPNAWWEELEQRFRAKGVTML